MTDSMWNDRFAREGYFFGTDPAAFLKAQAHHIPVASDVLVPADGEGRNSVWLAEQGHRVTAFDYAPAGVEKGQALAKARGVRVTFDQGDITAWDWTARPWDAVVGIFFQFAAPQERTEIFLGMAQALRPGGVLLIHGYAPRQVDYGTGGPPWPEHLYTLELLAAAFPEWAVLHQADYDADIEEGEGHSGRSGLIDFVAVKPMV